MWEYTCSLPHFSYGNDVEAHKRKAQYYYRHAYDLAFENCGSNQNAIIGISQNRADFLRKACLTE
jgi:hypothetical protein